MDQKPPLSGSTKGADVSVPKGAEGAGKPPGKVKKRRHRRTAAEIERTHACTYPGCSKAYGSESSLNQHIRLKHSKVNSASPKRFGQFPIGMGMFPMGMMPPYAGAAGALFPGTAGAQRPSKKLKSPDCSPLLLPKPSPSMLPMQHLSLNDSGNGETGGATMPTQQQMFLQQQQFMQQFMAMSQAKLGGDGTKQFVTPLQSGEAGGTSPPAFSLGDNAFSLGEAALKPPVIRNRSVSAPEMPSGMSRSGANTGLTLLGGGSSPRKGAKHGGDKPFSRSLGGFSPLTSPVSTPTFDNDMLAAFELPGTPGKESSSTKDPSVSSSFSDKPAVARPVTIKKEQEIVGSPRRYQPLGLDDDPNVGNGDLLEWTKSLFPADELGDDAFGKAMAAAFTDKEEAVPGQGQQQDSTAPPNGNPQISTDQSLDLEDIGVFAY